MVAISSSVSKSELLISSNTHHIHRIKIFKENSSWPTVRWTTLLSQTRETEASSSQVQIQEHPMIAILHIWRLKNQNERWTAWRKCIRKTWLNIKDEDKLQSEWSTLKLNPVSRSLLYVRRSLVKYIIEEYQALFPHPLQLSEVFLCGKSERHNQTVQISYSQHKMLKLRYTRFLLSALFS